MPNYAITSVYQPFSFQERIAPLQMLKEEYDKVGETLANYSDDSNAYYQYLDPNSRAQVDKYNATLQSVADSLSRDGLKSVSRNTLFDLKRMYNSQIKPINEAAKGYSELQEQVRKMQMQDPTLIVNGMPTVSDLMSNPGATPSMISGATLYKQGTLAASQLPDISYEQIQRYLAGDTTAIPNIDSIASQIGGMYGVDGLNDEGKQRAMGYILQGIGDGISTRTAEQAAYERKLATQHQYDHQKIWDQASASVWAAKQKTNESIRLAERKAELSSSKGSRGGSGTSYTTQAKHSAYFKGENTYLLDKEIQEARSDGKSKMQPKDFIQLSDENKRKVLSYIGIEVPMGANLDNIIIDNWDTLTQDYQYWEYEGKNNRRDPNEFMIVPNTRVRDVASSSQPDGFMEEVDEDLLID